MKNVDKIKELENEINKIIEQSDKITDEVKKQSVVIDRLREDNNYKEGKLFELQRKKVKLQKEIAKLKNKNRGLYAVKLIPHGTVKEFETTEELFLFINNSIKDCIKNKERLHSIVIEINPDRKIKEK